MKRYAVIVAAGTGSRMNNGLPKQFLLLAGKPVLYYSLHAFWLNDAGTELIVVLAKEEVQRWQVLCQTYDIDIPHKIVTGGVTRTQSVRNGLASVSAEGLVAIHDGARPLISNSIIESCFLSAEKYGTGVASVKPKDSVRQLSEGVNRAVDRENLCLIQTPQTFQTQLIKKAFELFGDGVSTDDATIAEKAGFPINLIEGSYRNFKITTSEDLVWAEALLR